jgi:hypothetical protein
MKIVVFQWADAQMLSEWSERTDELPTLAYGTVGGLLVSETDKELTVALQYFEGGDWRNLLTVPKSWIHNRQDFEISVENKDDASTSEITY